jgi:hypothetical protein
VSEAYPPRAFAAEGAPRTYSRCRGQHYLGVAARSRGPVQALNCPQAGTADMLTVRPSCSRGTPAATADWRRVLPKPAWSTQPRTTSSPPARDACLRSRSVQHGATQLDADRLRQ